MTTGSSSQSEPELALLGMEAATRTAEEKRQKVDSRWSDEIKQQQHARIDAALAAELATLRTKGLEAISEQRRRAETAHARAVLEAGPLEGERAEAAAALAFAADDLAAAGPDDVMIYFNRAKDGGGDKLALWAAERAGQRRLRDLRDGDSSIGTKARAGERAAELHAALYGKADDSRDSRLQKLAELERQLKQPVGAGERDAAAAHVRAKYGIG